MRAILLLIGVAGLAGCGRDSPTGPGPATGPVVEENRGPPVGYRAAVADYLREARAAADVLDRSPPPPAATAEDAAERVNDLYNRLPPAPAGWDRKADLEVLLKRINEETTLGATWAAKADRAARGAKTGEESELVRKYGESLKEAVKTIRDRADQADGILSPRK